MQAVGDEHSDMPPLLAAAAGWVALAVAMGIGRFAFTPLLPMMQDDAGLSLAAAGWLASANYIGYLLGALSAIVLRASPTAVIRAALLVIGLTTFAMGLTDNYAAWLLLRAAAGVASAWVLVFVSAWGVERLAQRAELNGLVFAGVGGGIVIAGMAALVLAHAQAGSRSAWMTLGALSCLLTVSIWPAFASRRGSAPPVAEIAAPKASNRRFIRLIACYGLFGFGYIIPATFLPAMAKQILADPGVYGWAWPVFGAAAMVSTFAAAAWGRAAGNRRLWAAGHLLMALGVALPIFSSHLLTIILAALLVGGTFMVITMAAVQEAREFAGAQARMLIAAMTAAFAVGQIIGPLAAGYAASHYGEYTAPLLAASILLAASGVWLWSVPDSA